MTVVVEMELKSPVLMFYWQFLAVTGDMNGLVKSICRTCLTIVWLSL